MLIEELSISGCYLIKPQVSNDKRGCFVKLYHAEKYQEMGIEFSLQEEFYSVSFKHVLRGLHFQKPPFAHNKIVYCAYGKVSDFIVDLRLSSATYGQHLTIDLSSENAYALYLPIGIAHGFLSCTEHSIMVYKTDNVYNPKFDEGILWHSLGLNVDCDNPIVSDRDLNFTAFNSFESPFQ